MIQHTGCINIALMFPHTITDADISRMCWITYRPRFRKDFQIYLNESSPEKETELLDVVHVQFLLYMGEF